MQQVEHMAAPTGRREHPNIQIGLANGEPSTHDPKRTSGCELEIPVDGDVGKRCRVALGVYGYGLAFRIVNLRFVSWKQLRQETRLG
jgi:hypothetical protein